MNAAKQAAWFFCLLVALACSGWYYASSLSITRLDENTLSKAADMIVANLTVKRYDETGKLANYFQSPEVQHIPDNDTHFITSPRLALAQSNQPAWEITSQFAKAIHKGEQITFTNNVVIHQNQSPTNQESTLKTEELTYFPKSKLATSQTTVSFEQPGRTVHSEGIIAYLAEKRVQLLNQARATFEPNKDA